WTRWDEVGNKRLVIDPEGHKHQYFADGLGRIRAEIDGENQPSYTSYLDDTLVGERVDRRGTPTLYTYDNLGRPRRTSVLDQNNVEIWHHLTTYQDLPL